MSDAALKVAQICELRDAISELQAVRDVVSGFDVSSYEEAGSGKWAGQKRNSFVNVYESAKSQFSQLREEVFQSMVDCDSKRQMLLYSIDPVKDAAEYQQALVAATPRVA